MEFTIKDMSCGHCVSVITKTVQQLDPLARVQVELAAKKVVVDRWKQSGLESVSDQRKR